MTITSLIKSVQEIMRQDAGVDGDAQRISQLVWLLFLKVYDAKEQDWEVFEEDYRSIIPEELRWRNWAEDSEGITGDELVEFINEKLFKTLKDITIDESTDKRGIIVKEVFEDSYNYMKSGTLLRQLINKLNEIDFSEYEDRHAFNDIYENILRDLQSAKNAGEFYTPRPLTDFIIERLDPKVGERIADFACGTGGFLVSALNYLEDQIETVEDRKTVQNSLFGVEKKPLPHLLCMTNLVLHDVDAPNILRDNSLATSLRDYPESQKYDVIAMNPPFGGIEEAGIQMNFPKEFRTTETADLFMALIMYRLKKDGRVGLILPDGFLFGNDGAKLAIKEKLLAEFNLHTIIRVPNGTFAPYTSISANLLFFDKSKATEKIDYYQVPIPDGLKNGFTKTKPLKSVHLNGVRDWWNDRENGDENAYSVTLEDVSKAKYNLDFKNPKTAESEESHSLNELLEIMGEKSRSIEATISKLSEILKGIHEPKDEALSSAKMGLLKTIKLTREKVLEEAIKGKLVEQDPEDESASILLEKIAEEKDRLVAEKVIKNSKPLPEITEDEIPFEIPENWEWVRLGVVSYKLTDGSHNPPKGIDGAGYPMLSAVNIDKIIDFNKPTRIISEEDFKKEHSRTNIEKYDILLTIVGSIGRAVVVESEELFALQRSVAVLKTGMNPYYLKYTLISKFFYDQMYSNAKGTAQLGIYLGKLSELIMPLPPLAEQRRIVQKVDAIMELCDNLEEQLL